MQRKTGSGPPLASAAARITVFSSPREPHRGLLRCGPLVLPCALGRAGISHLKREGDGATPAGRHRLLWFYVRRDRAPGPATRLPCRATRRADGWCDAPFDARYNRPLRLPSPVGHELLWREDRLYDVVGVLDWNMRPRVSGRGSAIFLHLCRPGFAPTQGCIALSPSHLRLLLQRLGPGTEFAVAAKPRRRMRPPRPKVAGAPGAR